MPVMSGETLWRLAFLPPDGWDTLSAFTSEEPGDTLLVPILRCLQPLPHLFGDGE
jgi:hypothetical protein